MTSQTLSMTATPRPEESPRTIEDRIVACMAREDSIAALIYTLARSEAFQGIPADCLEGVAELVARQREALEALAEAHERCEGNGGAR
jgi:hypothetical protein